MTQYMLLFSLGPVQTFIAQARKTRDSWLGSYLLSTLMQAAMKGIDHQAFVFPTKRTIFDPETGRDDIPDIPNKYIALFDDLIKAQTIAEQSKGRVVDQWEIIYDTVWNEVIEGKHDEETHAIWKRQTNFDTLFETYWAIVERKDGQSYGDWLDATESVFAARKRLRDFRAQEEPGEKSTISGDREILRGSRTDHASIKAFWKKIAVAQSLNDIDQEGDEHLDAIDLVKRFAMKAKGIIPEKPFPSTSSIATASFVEGLLTKGVDTNALEDWRSITRPELAGMPVHAIPFLYNLAGAKEWILKRDGDIYFPDTFTEYRFKKDYHLTDAKAARRKAIATEGAKALSGLLRATDADGLNISRPTPYYAVIQMDGDNMGILLSGVKDEPEHRDISGALSDFSRKIAPPLVQDRYPGRLVYAGGDDVLAFAPLARDVPEEQKTTDPPRYILDLVDQLRLQYCKKVKDALPPTENQEERRNGVTASTGIVIAHHYTSLSYVLRSAREAESLAKKRYGRNALVVTIIRRSGEQTRVGCHWRYKELGTDEHPGQPIALFTRLYEWFKHDVLSPKCVYTLLEEAPTLIGLGQDAQKSEIKRVLLRQLSSDKKSASLQNEIEHAAGQLSELAGAMDADKRDAEGKKQLMAVELHSDQTRYGIIETLGWLLVMAFLARKDQE